MKTFKSLLLLGLIAISNFTSVNAKENVLVDWCFDDAWEYGSLVEYFGGDAYEGMNYFYEKHCAGHDGAE